MTGWYRYRIGAMIVIRYVGRNIDEPLKSARTLKLLQRQSAYKQKVGL